MIHNLWKIYNIDLIQVNIFFYILILENSLWNNNNYILFLWILFVIDFKMKLIYLNWFLKWNLFIIHFSILTTNFDFIFYAICKWRNILLEFKLQPSSLVKECGLGSSKLYELVDLRGMWRSLNIYLKIIQSC